MGYLWAIDSSMKRTAISIFDNDGKYLKTVSIETDAKETHAKRLDKIGHSAIELGMEYEPSDVAFENGFIRYNKSSQAVYKVLGVLQYVLSHANQFFYAPKTVKKVVGGNGNIGKEDLRKIIKEKYGVELGNLDESDSFCVGMCHLESIKK